MEKIQNLKVRLLDPTDINRLGIYQYDRPIILNYDLLDDKGVSRPEYDVMWYVIRPDGQQYEALGMGGEVTLPIDSTNLAGMIKILALIKDLPDGQNVGGSYYARVNKSPLKAVSDTGEGVSTVDLSNYYTKAEVDQKISTLSAPDLTPYALKSDIPTVQQLADLEESGEIAAAIASLGMEQYALKTDIPAPVDTSSLATIETVTALDDRVTTLESKPSGGLPVYNLTTDSPMTQWQTLTDNIQGEGIYKLSTPDRLVTPPYPIFYSPDGTNITQQYQRTQSGGGEWTSVTITVDQVKAEQPSAVIWDNLEMDGTPIYGTVPEPTLMKGSSVGSVLIIIDNETYKAGIDIMMNRISFSKTGDTSGEWSVDGPAQFSTPNTYPVTI